jgi:hypothetical protein
MLGTPHGQDPSLGNTIRLDRVGPTYPFGEADRPDFAVITRVVPSPPPAPRRTFPVPRRWGRRAAIPSAPACAARNCARCTSAKVVTIPRSAISHDRTFCGSAPSSRVSVVIAVGSSIGSTTRQPAASASAVRVNRPNSASRRTTARPTARFSPSATERPTRAATSASPSARHSITGMGSSHSGGGSRGRNRCTKSGRTASIPTPCGPAINSRDDEKIASAPIAQSMWPKACAASITDGTPRPRYTSAMAAAGFAPTGWCGSPMVEVSWVDSFVPHDDPAPGAGMTVTRSGSASSGRGSSDTSRTPDRWSSCRRC